MPRAWTAKEERQYQHIEESARKRGASPSRAREIAARTVNKERRKEGKTDRRRTRGTGNPNRSLEDRTKDELYNLARQRDISHRSQMGKQQLVRALRD
jgi:plasmid stabilization system protein ParE